MPCGWRAEERQCQVSAVNCQSLIQAGRISSGATILNVRRSSRRAPSPSRQGPADRLATRSSQLSQRYKRSSWTAARIARAARPWAAGASPPRRARTRDGMPSQSLPSPSIRGGDASATTSRPSASARAPLALNRLNRIAKHRIRVGMAFSLDGALRPALAVEHGSDIRGCERCIGAAPENLRGIRIGCSRLFRPLTLACRRRTGRPRPWRIVDGPAASVSLYSSRFRAGPDPGHVSTWTRAALRGPATATPRDGRPARHRSMESES